MTAAGEALERLAGRAREAGRIGVDTEFVGEGRYRTLLCLVQLVVEDGKDGEGTRIEVVDALDATTDPTPLLGVLADPAVEVVVHAGRQDVALLRRCWQTEVRSLFDTQVAAGFAGLRAQSGYDGLLREVLGVRLAKTASYTRWDRRPLTDEQLGYAREDVLHLLALARSLQGRLAELDRLQWAREECAPLEHASDERTAESAFARLPRIGGLDPAIRAIAYELASWREGLAEESDRPVQTVLNDSSLVEIARRRPTSRQQLEEIRGVNAGSLRRHSDQLLAAIARGRERPPLASDSRRRPPPADADAPLVAISEALVRSRALQSGVAYELVATRADLQEIVLARRTGSSEPDVRTLRGWRRELVGAELLELLAGRRGLEVGPDLGLRVTGDG